MTRRIGALGESCFEHIYAVYRIGTSAISEEIADTASVRWSCSTKNVFFCVFSGTTTDRAPEKKEHGNTISEITAGISQTVTENLIH